MQFILSAILALTFLGSSKIFAEETRFSSFSEIAKINCHDILSIRKEMDKINDDILKLLTERAAYVKRAGDLKSKTIKIADDRQVILTIKNCLDQDCTLLDICMKIIDDLFPK